VNLNFVVKKTFQISESDFNSYCDIFNLIFKKKLSNNDLKKKYLSGKDGYAIHSLLYNDEEICAGFTLIPYNYIFNNKKIIIALGCDAFVKKEYRCNEMILYKLYKNLTKTQLSEDIKFVISIPNSRASKYWEIIAKWKKIGNLNLKIFPLNLFKMKFLWKRIFFFLNYFSSDNNNFELYIDTNKSFLETRFYGYEKYKNSYFKIYREGKYSVLYLFCIDSISSNEKINLFRYLFKNYDIDFFSVCTNYDFKPFIKVPKYLIDRDINVMINKEFEPNNYKFSKWALSLTNFDNR
tara:strand:+ start:19 stop:900 length:882 start_codon:yes stop_codon:yes gene_type:complete